MRIVAVGLLVYGTSFAANGAGQYTCGLTNRIDTRGRSSLQVLTEAGPPIVIKRFACQAPFIKMVTRRECSALPKFTGRPTSEIWLATMRFESDKVTDEEDDEDDETSIASLEGSDESSVGSLQRWEPWPRREARDSVMRLANREIDPHRLHFSRYTSAQRRDTRPPSKSRETDSSLIEHSGKVRRFFQGVSSPYYKLGGRNQELRFGLPDLQIPSKFQNKKIAEICRTRADARTVLQYSILVSSLPDLPPLKLALEFTDAIVAQDDLPSGGLTI